MEIPFRLDFPLFFLKRMILLLVFPFYGKTHKDDCKILVIFIAVWLL